MSLNNVRHIDIDSSVDGKRLDAALASLLPDLSRSAVARLIEEKKVSIGDTIVTKPSRSVHAGDSISIEITPPRSPDDVGSQDIPIRILFQDADIAVIDKPSGLVVHPASGHPDSTLVNALLFHLSDLSGLGGVLRPGIVHRLDKDTSGVMIVAKHDEAHRKLTASWGTDAVRKEYLAIVYGTPRSAAGTIDAPIGRDPRDRKRMAVVAGGRKAVTQYEVLERLKHASLLRCVLKTGRTHQIRVHLKHLGHPIVGDRVYSGPQWRGVPEKPIQKAMASMKRQALHAAKITFPHPRSGETMTFESALPEDIAGVLAALR